MLKFLLHPTGAKGDAAFNTGNRDEDCDLNKANGGVRVARRRMVMDDMGR